MGHEAFLHFLVWLEDGSDDEVDRLGRAERAHIRADVAALAVDRVAGGAAEFGTLEYLRATPGVAAGFHLLHQHRRLIGIERLGLVRESRRRGDDPGESFVPAPAGAHQAKAYPRGVARGFHIGKGRGQAGGSVLALQERGPDFRPLGIRGGVAEKGHGGAGSRAGIKPGQGGDGPGTHGSRRFA